MHVMLFFHRQIELEVSCRSQGPAQKICQKICYIKVCVLTLVLVVHVHASPHDHDLRLPAQLIMF